jgi:hypothetical protein
MSVFLDQSGSAQSADAFSDCLQISRGDGNLGDTPVSGDTTVIQLTYDGSTPADPTAARLFDLVHSNYGAGTVVRDKIVITALSGGIDPISGVDVTGNGVTYVDPHGGDPIIRVVYDMNNCNGSGIFVFDVSSNKISLARPPLLYHELSHAFRAATNSNLPNDEPPAETDENVMRAELGYCLRDVNNHDGGCGHGDDCSGPPTPDSSGCFIVSASTGSPQSSEVRQLRALRDRVAAGSNLAAGLIDAIYAEYARFSPPIAAEIDKAVPARQAVLWVVVRPLLAWYALAGVLAFEHLDRKAVSRAARALAGSCPRLLGKRTVTGLLDTLRKGEALPPDAPALLQAFAPQIALAATLPFAAWAILDALALAWSAGAHQREAQEAVARWLAAAPLEALPLPEDGAHLERDLAALARLFDFNPAARAPLGQRLAATRPDAAPALARHGFLSAGVSR